MPKLDNEHAALECRTTPWDERIFGYQCAEITSFQARDEEAGREVFDQFEAWARAEDVHFAYGRFEPNQLVKRILHEAGFYFAEASYRIRHPKLQGTTAFDSLIRMGPLLEPATDLDHDALRSILANDFRHGRIHEDPWIAPASASLRYHNWLTDLLIQQHEIYSYRFKDEVIGLHIQRGNDEKVDLVLTGLKKSHSVLGISLWANVLQLNRLRGVREVHTIISAANLPIINLYLRFDFKFEALLLGFHKRWPA